MIAHPGEVECAYGANDLVCDNLAIGERAVFEKDGKLIAADTGCQIMFAAGAADGLRHLLEESVARGMSGCVVDRFEPIQIDIEHTVPSTTVTRRRDGHLQAFLKGTAIWQSGQIIMVGRMQKLALQRTALRDILEHQDRAAYGAVRGHHG